MITLIVLITSFIGLWVFGIMSNIGDEKPDLSGTPKGKELSERRRERDAYKEDLKEYNEEEILKELNHNRIYRREWMKYYDALGWLEYKVYRHQKSLADLSSEDKYINSSGLHKKIKALKYRIENLSKPSIGLYEHKPFNARSAKRLAEVEAICDGLESDLAHRAAVLQEKVLEDNKGWITIGVIGAGLSYVTLWGSFIYGVWCLFSELR